MVWWVRHISWLGLGCFGLVSCACQQTGEDLAKTSIITMWWDETGTDSTAKAHRLWQQDVRDTQMDVLDYASPMALVRLTVHAPITAVWVISPSTINCHFELQVESHSSWIWLLDCPEWENWLDWSEITFIFTACMDRHKYVMLVLQR